MKTIIYSNSYMGNYSRQLHYNNYFCECLPAEILTDSHPSLMGEGFLVYTFWIASVSMVEGHCYTHVKWDFMSTPGFYFFTPVE